MAARNGTKPIHEAVLSLYDLTANVEQVINTHYADNAVFHDPLVYVQGRPDVKAQFQALKVILRRSELDVHSVTQSKDHIVLDFTMKAYWRLLPGFLATHVHSIVTLELRNDKVFTHNDHWSIRDMISHNVPILGWAYDIWRPVFGKASSVAFRVIGHVGSGLWGEAHTRGQGALQVAEGLKERSLQAAEQLKQR